MAGKTERETNVVGALSVQKNHCVQKTSRVRAVIV